MDRKELTDLAVVLFTIFTRKEFIFFLLISSITIAMKLNLIIRESVVKKWTIIYFYLLIRNKY